MTQPAIPRETVAITNEAEGFALEAAAFRVTSQPDYESAGTMLTAIKGRAAQIDTERKRITKPMDEAKKAVLDFFRPVETKLSDAETAIKRAMLSYKRDADALVAEAMRRAEDAAAKERAKLEARADRAEARGKDDEADRLRTEAAVMPVSGAIGLDTGSPKAQGISTRITWRAEVEDLHLLCVAIAEGKAQAELVQPNQAALNKMAGALKDSLRIPGVRSVKEETMVARG